LWASTPLQKDRWAWRKTVKRIAITCLVLVFACLALVLILTGVGYQYWEQFTAAKQLPAKLSRQTEYAGLRLGLTQDEIMYIKGLPSHVFVKDITDPKSKDRYSVVETKDWGEREKVKRIKDHEAWAFRGDYHTIFVSFSKESPNAVSDIQCNSYDQIYRCPAIGDIQDGNSEEEVNRKLGPPSRSRIEGVVKTLVYEWYRR
jgi:hypothetical protein